MSNLSLSEFVERVGQIMPVMMREFFRQQSGEFYKLKITMPQFVVMEILSRQPDSKMSELAHFINVTTAAMTGIVDRLVRYGYIKRGNDPEDRRVVRVSLTPKGSKTVTSIVEDRKKHMGRIFGMISQEERREYLKILEHVKESLESNKE